MQTAGMLRGTRATYLIALLITLIGCTHSYPLQILSSIPGHVPVYIRHGDEPLEHIHPGLAEAFHEPPSSKSFRLEDFPSPEQISFDEASRYLARFNNKIIFPAYPRDPEASTIDSLNDLKEEEKESGDSKVPPHDQVHDDEETGEEHHGHSKRNSPSLLKEAMIKLSPISDVEREKLAVQVAKKEIGSGNRDSNSNQADESSKGTSRKDLLEGSATAFDIQRPENDDILNKAGTKRGEEPVKQENPGIVLANVQKLFPISLDEKKDSAQQSSTMKKDVSSNQEGPMNIHILPGIVNSAEILESSETNDSSANEESTKKAIHREHPLANVKKLLAVSPLEQKTNAEKAASDFTSEKQENSNVMSTYVHIIPTISVSTDDSELSEVETAEVNGELPIKVEQSENTMANVLKFSPGSSEGKSEMVSLGGSVLTSAVGEEKEAKEVGNHDSNNNHGSNVSSGKRMLPLKLSPRIGIVSNVGKLAPKEAHENEKNDEIAMD